MRVINLAQGELVLLAAYIAYSVESGLGLNPVLAIPIALVVVCLTSAIVYFVVSRIKKDREINSLILTYGIGVILTNGMLLIWKADIRSTSSEWLQEAFVLGPFYSMRSEVLFFGVSLLMMAALVVALAQLVCRARCVPSPATAMRPSSWASIPAIPNWCPSSWRASWRPSPGWPVQLWRYQPGLWRGAHGQGFHHHGIGRCGLDSGRADRRDPAGRGRGADRDPGQLGAAGAGRHGLFLLVLFIMPNGLFGVRARRG
jgi:branched-chain amino acid transport system permease protein